MLGWISLFVPIFLVICGIIAVFNTVRELFLPPAPATYIKAADCDGLEYRVRRALLGSRGDVVVIIPARMVKNREFILICKALMRDEPRVRLLEYQRKGQ